MHKRVFERDARDRASLQPSVQYRAEFSIPEAMKECTASSFTTRLCRTVLYRPRRSPINAVVWTPEHRGTLNGAAARYVITGSSRGDFTVWNSHTYEKETFTTTHDCAIRDMTWTHDQRWLVSCDDSGKVKYYNASLRWQKIFQAHDRSCRALSFAPTDAKFATCSDDKTVRVWDFKTQQEDAKLDGHGWDVKCVSWHPQKSLLASGSKDRVVKLWDPRNGKCIVSLESHKHTVNRVEWNRNGIWLLTASRDQQSKLFDIRMINEELDTYFHETEITSLAWHPIHEDLFASGDKSGHLYVHILS
jgi:polyadenylation factor subunit 2